MLSPEALSKAEAIETRIGRSTCKRNGFEGLDWNDLQPRRRCEVRISLRRKPTLRRRLRSSLSPSLRTNGHFDTDAEGAQLPISKSMYRDTKVESPSLKIIFAVHRNGP